VVGDSLFTVFTAFAKLTLDISPGLSSLKPNELKYATSLRAFTSSAFPPSDAGVAAAAAVVLITSPVYAPGIDGITVGFPLFRKHFLLPSLYVYDVHWAFSQHLSAHP
jgi:hypothetical protein